ncbi:ATP-binding protein [Paraburkholderia sp. SARCC-3016]|uniref:hybrid sensor histidine kinase/response regulator n=1 Tax=Paraburkholderia sp. SARCC-3016 TaxID=3058611 RepID=UPI00280816E3|nr:ATP-binding protein [Paraburkholderia sp. SARCC-3016]MDQ7977217.1 ATP-binding protein [Paraburkholderia sp. SARCC-3016]
MNTTIAPEAGPYADLALHIRFKRWRITRRWLRAVRSDPSIEPADRLTNRQLIDLLPQLYDEICSALTAVPNSALNARIDFDARQYARKRWMHGYQLDELYRELDLLQVSVQHVVREYFADTLSPRAEQAGAHQTIESFFSATIHGAIRQLLDEQNQRIGASLRERDRALAARQESDERLRIAAGAAGLGIFEWNAGTRSGVWENARMFEITGQPIDVGPLTNEAFMRDFIHPDDAAAFVERYRADEQAHRPFHTVFRAFRIGDRALRVLEMHGRFRYDAHGVRHSFVGTLADITARANAQEALKEADRRKDVFLATLAHELRNPLAPIRNAAHVLKQDSEDLPPKIRWVQAVLERQSHHLSHLIDDLLDVSRITTGRINLKREVLDLRDAIGRAMEINGPAAEQRRHRIFLNTRATPIPVDGDRTRLTQILSNLVDNAIKYTDDGGEIHIRAEVVNGRARIAVKDSGIGVAAAELPALFDLFMQATPPAGRARDGLGIGLFVARKLIDMHGGTISVSSDGVGKGCEFSITLPLAGVPVPATASPADTPLAGEHYAGRRDADVPKRRLRILIVDDNRDAAESLALVLDMHDTRTAADGPSALALAEQYDPDVALLDIALPGMSGHEIARHLAAQSQRVCPVLIALTGFSQPEDFARSRASGFAHHLVKPVSPDALIELMHTIARTRQGQ